MREDSLLPPSLRNHLPSSRSAREGQDAPDLGRCQRALIGASCQGLQCVARRMDDDLKAELKSTRSSLGGGSARGFMGAVEHVSEAVHHDYYAFLNVTADSSEEDIRAAYKRLALLWHPDRHKEEEARERATAQFAKLQKIHAVLTDPKKRKLYDLYGEKGLASGMEVGAHLRTHEQVRDEYLRQMGKKTQARLEAKLGVSGMLQTSLNVHHYLAPWLEPGGAAVVSFAKTQRRNGVAAKRARQDNNELAPPPVLTTTILAQRFRTRVSKKDEIELHGQVVSKLGTGGGLLTLIGKRQLSVRSWAMVTWQTGPGISDMPLSLAAFRQLSEDMSSKLSLRMSNELVQLRCSLLQKLASDAMGKIQYILGGEEAGVKVRASRAGERTSVSANLWVGVQQYSLGARWNRQLSQRSTVAAALKLGAGGAVLEASSHRRFSGNSHVGCQCVLSLLKGVTLKLSLGRLGQDIHVPILLWYDPVVCGPFLLLHHCREARPFFIAFRACC